MFVFFDLIMSLGFCLFIVFLFQGKCEAAYFIVVLHQLKSVVIAVRGTETPEDLITDGLCRECTLSIEDLDGLIKQVSLSLSIYLHVRGTCSWTCGECFCICSSACVVFLFYMRSFILFLHIRVRVLMIIAFKVFEFEFVFLLQHLVQYDSSCLKVVSKICSCLWQLSC